MARHRLADTKVGFKIFNFMAIKAYMLSKKWGIYITWTGYDDHDHN